MSLKMTVVGTDKVIRALESLGTEAAQAMAYALYNEAEGLIGEAKPQTPVDTGVLRASGYVQQPQISGTNVTVECGFGGAAQGYAIYVHENLEARHKAGTNAKYLERPMRKRAGGVLGRVSQRIVQYAKRFA